jgi:hypothetical protein
MSNQIISIRFSVPDSWDAESFAADMGECYAELNSDTSDQVSIVGIKKEDKVYTFTAGQRYMRRGK